MTWRGQVGGKCSDERTEFSLTKSVYQRGRTSAVLHANSLGIIDQYLPWACLTPAAGLNLCSSPPEGLRAARAAISKLIQMSAFPADLASILDSLTLIAPTPQAAPLVVVAAEKCAANGASFIKPPWHLYQLRDTEVRLVRFRKKLQ